MFVLQRVILHSKISKERPINTCMPYVPSFSDCAWLNPYRSWRSKLCILAGPFKVYRILNASERCIEFARRKDKKLDLRLFEEYMWYFRASTGLDVKWLRLSGKSVCWRGSIESRDTRWTLWIFSLIIHRRRNWDT